MRYHEGMDERRGRDSGPERVAGADSEAGTAPEGGAGSEADVELGKGYDRTLYDVHLPGGTVTLMVRRAPLGNSGPIRDRRLAIVTAHNPGHERPGDEANRAANERLRAEIERREWTWCAAVGYSPERNHEEPSFAVLDVREDEVLELARQFRQRAIFVWDGRRGRLAWC